MNAVDRASRRYVRCGGVEVWKCGCSKEDQLAKVKDKVVIRLCVQNYFEQKQAYLLITANLAPITHPLASLPGRLNPPSR